MRQKQNDPPSGILQGSFLELHAAGCIQTFADRYDYVVQVPRDYIEYFTMLRLATRGNLCNGCTAYDGGKCKAFRQYHTAAQTVPTTATKPPGTEHHPGKTIRQIAAELGISLSEARRRKLAGTL